MFEKAFKFFKSIGYDGQFNLGMDETANNTGLQFNERNGLLCGMIKTANGTYTLPSDNFEQIVSAFKTSTFATVVRVYILTPIDRTKPSFVLALIPSAKQENSDDLLEEWRNIEILASKWGLAIVANGMDGEPKQLSAQRRQMTDPSNTFFEFQSEKFKGIKIPVHTTNEKEYPSASFQDPTHVVGKERNNLLSESRTIKIKHHEINLECIKRLLQLQTEIRIGVRFSDLRPKDKMNFDAVRRLCAPSTVEILQREKDPSWFYLKFIHYSGFSFIQPNMSLKERVQRMAYAAYFAVTWRTLNESKHRITSNQLQCVVMNFVNLVGFISYYQHHFPDVMVSPWIFGSQENEQFFRTLRLMGGNYTSGVNFTIRDVIFKASTISFVQNLAKNYKDHILIPIHQQKI